MGGPEFYQGLRATHQNPGSHVEVPELVPRMRMADKVAVGWLDPALMDGMFGMSMINLATNRRDRIDAWLRVENNGLISRGRNELAFRFLETTDCQWLLMLDSDMQLDIAGFDRLIGVAHDTDRPVVAGLYFGAWPGEFFPTPIPLIFLQRPDSMRFVPILDYPDDKVIPVDSAGTGCLLIHRSVFEKVRADANPHQGDRWCWFQDMPVNADWFSEDHWFCCRVRELGFPIHAHTGVVLPHRKRFWLSDKQYVKPDLTEALNGLSELQGDPVGGGSLPGLRVRDDGEAAGERDDREETPRP